jgi:hypothetical protein
LYFEIENTQYEFKTWLAEATGDIAQGLDLTWPKFEAQLKEVKAWAFYMADLHSTTEA